MKKTNGSIASKKYPSHQLLIGPPLFFITLFAFGFMILHQHSAAEHVSATKPKPAPSALRPSGGLTVNQPTLPTLSPDGSPSDNPEDNVPPQLPGVASTNIQAAQQRWEAAPNSENAAPQARLKSLNRVIESRLY